MKRKQYARLIGLLSVILVFLLAVLLFTNPKKDPQEQLQQPSESQTAPVTNPTGSTAPSSDPTTPTATEPPVTQPPVTEPPATVPTEPTGEMIGSMYTREFIESLDGTYTEYGPGKFPLGVRPYTAAGLTDKFQKYDTYFIGPDDNKVYLTFNCGYEQLTADGKPITGIILDVLKEKNVKAVFFLALHYCEANPELVQRMIDEGHIVANHGARHKCMPKQTIDGMVKEIMDLHNYVQEHFGYTMKYYRPASGEYSEQVFAVAQSLGYTTLQFSFSYYDYDVNNPPSDSTAFETMSSRLHNGAIYQLHTVVPGNANVLGQFIDHLRAQSYEPSLFTP